MSFPLFSALCVKIVWVFSMCLCGGLVLLLFCRRGRCRGDSGFFATRLFCPPFLLGSSLSFGGFCECVPWLVGVLYVLLLVYLAGGFG